MKEIEPGWFIDPADPKTQRYWDGEGWVGKALPADATPPDGPPEPEPEPVTEDTSTSATDDPGDADPIATSAAEFQRPASPITQREPGVQPPADAIPVKSLGMTVGWITPKEIDRVLDGRILANPGKRFAARIIDFVCLLGLNLVINGYFLYEYLSTLAPYASEYAAGASLDDMNVPLSELQQQQWVIIGIAVALWFAYEVPATLNTGQTVGKRLMGIKVVSLAPPSQDSQKTSPLGWGRLTARWMYFGLPLVCFPFGVIVWIIDGLWCTRDKPFKQCLHDKSPSTAVVLVDNEKTETPNET